MDLTYRNHPAIMNDCLIAASVRSIGGYTKKKVWQYSLCEKRLTDDIGVEKTGICRTCESSLTL